MLSEASNGGRWGESSTEGTLGVGMEGAAVNWTERSRMWREGTLTQGPTLVGADLDLLWGLVWSRRKLRRGIKSDSKVTFAL